MPALEVHPSGDELSAFSLGQLDGDRLSVVEHHVADCPSCQTRAAGAADDRLVALLRAVHVCAEQGSDTVRDALNQTLDVPLPAVSSETVGLLPSGSPGDAAADAVPGALANHERYRVLHLLGQGGMGSVYQAEHRLMERSVALKVINRAFTANSTAVERFQREVRAAARLSHPNIVQAFDAEHAGDMHFLVMEYIAGATLASLVRERGPLSVMEACEYVRQAALGLQHAHERGMVHRDIKPENLILTEGGMVKVLDFGLASLTAETGPEGLTAENAVMGTPDYMAPEQAEDARSADIRADVYSLGCTLYFLLTGQVPYPAPTPMRKILAHREQPLPSLRELPADLAVVLRRLMEKQPHQRYQTPGDVVAALTPFTRPREQKPRRAWPWVAAGLFLATLVAAIVVQRIQTDKGELVLTIESDDVEVIVKQGGKIVRIVDRKTNKSITLRSGVYELELKGGEGLKLDLDRVTLTRGEVVLAKIERVKTHDPIVKDQPRGDEIRRFEGHENGAISVVFSRDGRFALAGEAGGGCMRLWEVATGNEVRILGSPRAPTGGLCVAISPDGKRAISAGNGTWSWDLETGRKVMNFETHGAPVGGAVFSPDGNLVLGGDYRGILHLWQAGSGKEVKLFRGHTDLIRCVAISPDGRLAASGSGDGSIRLWNLETGKEVHCCKGHSAIVASVAFSSKGDYVVSGSADRTVRLWDVAAGKEVQRCEGHTDLIHAVAFCPDGKRVLSGGFDGTLRLWDTKTGLELHRFSGHAAGTKPGTGGVLSVACSFDGLFALSGSYDGTMRLWKMPDTAKTVEPVVKEEPKAEKIGEVFRKRWDGVSNNCGVDLSPDGRLLISMHWNGVRVWDVLSGKVLHELEGSLAYFTPYGKTILTVSHMGEAGIGRGEGDGCLRLYDTDSGKLLRRFGRYPKGFSGMMMFPDGRHVMTGGADPKSVLWDFTTGKELPGYNYGPDFWGSNEVAEFAANHEDIVVERVLPGGREIMGRQPVDGKAFGIYDIRSNRLVRTIPLEGGDQIGKHWTSADYGRDRCLRLAVSRSDGVIHVLDLSAGKEIAHFDAGNFQPKCLKISADGRFLAACASNEKSDVVVWRLPEPSAKVKP